MAIENVSNITDENEPRDLVGTGDMREEEHTEPTQKKSAIGRFKAFLSRKKDVTEVETEKHSEKPAEKITKRAAAESFRKINDFFSTIESQLGRVDVQNNTLLEQISTLKDNNQSLLEQIQTLTENNNQLTEQFNNMKRREKIAKILAIISAILAIGLSGYNIVKLILNNI